MWLTLGKCYYSGTWSWVKPLTIPESPLVDLYNTCPVEGLKLEYILNFLAGPLFASPSLSKLWKGAILYSQHNFSTGWHFLLPNGGDKSSLYSSFVPQYFHIANACSLDSKLFARQTVECLQKNVEESFAFRKICGKIGYRPAFSPRFGGAQNWATEKLSTASSLST